jgi:hypothetical protein
VDAMSVPSVHAVDGAGVVVVEQVVQPLVLRLSRLGRPCWRLPRGRVDTFTVVPMPVARWLATNAAPTLAVDIRVVEIDDQFRHLLIVRTARGDETIPLEV